MSLLAAQHRLHRSCDRTNVPLLSLRVFYVCVCVSERGEGAPAAGDAGDGRAAAGSDHEEG